MLVKWANSPMVGARVVLGGVIAQIFATRAPDYLKNTLCLLAHQPKISHVHCTGPLAFNCAVRDPHRGRIIAMNGGGGLWVAQLLEGKSQYFCFLCVEEEGAEFGFGGGGGDASQDGAQHQNCAVEANGASVLGEGAEKNIPPARLCALGAVR